MEKKSDKKDKQTGNCVNYGFWSMILFFVLMVAFSALQWQWPAVIAGILFVISVFFVFISSILAVAPEGKGMAYVALGIAIIFILYILFSATLSVSSVLG